MSVGFADKDSQYYMEQGYTCDNSSIGNVYLPSEGVEISSPIVVRYEKHPWIERFEVDGIKILQPRRTGYGTKTVRAFVQSLNTIYSSAFEDYITYCGENNAVEDEQSGAPADGKFIADNYKDGFDATEYFSHVTKYFVQEFEDEQRAKMFGKYCGFVENMWREGDKQSHDVAMNSVLPIICMTEELSEEFHKHITEEFAEYIKNGQFLSDYSIGTI